MKSATVSVLRGFQTVRPSFDQIFGRLFWNFSDIGIPKGERIQVLNLEIILSPGEAAEGGILPRAFPSCAASPNAGDLGGTGYFPTPIAGNKE